jgi:hypothetical protein
VSYWHLPFVGVQLPPLPSGHNFVYQTTGSGVMGFYLLYVDPAKHKSKMGFNINFATRNDKNLLVRFVFRRQFNGEYTLFFPVWVPLVVSVAAGAICWQSVPKFSFSLRTMLIATTLVAVLLGLSVWLAS